MLADPRAEDAYDHVLTRLTCDRVGVLLSRLEARERMVLRAHFGLDGPEQTLRTIGRGLGIMVSLASVTETSGAVGTVPSVRFASAARRLLHRPS